MTQSVIALFTDFGVSDPYVGQMHTAILARNPPRPIVDLHHYAPAFAPEPASLLLEALASYLTQGSVVVGVVDPGVGTDRRSLAVSAAGLWLVGPDNGLFTSLLEIEGSACFRLKGPEAEQASASFHGRDIFAPAGAELARGNDAILGEVVADPVRVNPDRAQVIYVDHYGNLFTGLVAPSKPDDWRLRIRGRELEFARTFGELQPGELFWYRNSLDRVEIAAREYSAARALDGRPGTPVSWIRP